MTEPDPKSSRYGETWLPALPLDELWQGEMVGLSLGGSDVLLLKLAAEEVHAYDDHCPHAGARLSEGQLRGTTLRCRAHHWEFDVESGDGINPRKCKLARLGVRIDAGVVWVRVRANERG